MNDRCRVTRTALSAYVDGELSATEAERVAEHLTSCAHCSEEYQQMLESVGALRTQLAQFSRYPAPDVLRARIRTMLATTPPEIPSADEAKAPTDASSAETRRWKRAAAWAAVAVLAAALGSGVTLLAARRNAGADALASQVLASHVRSLMPNHLTDIASSDQHNVKPWFNGRLDYSPNVPRFEAEGFPLLGGRLDYVANRPVAVVVYGRRQHLINVFSWPATGSDESMAASASKGYTLLHWRRAGIEKWVVSDVNAAELKQFAGLVQRADSSATTR